MVLIVLLDLSEQVEDHWLLPPDDLGPDLATDGHSLGGGLVFQVPLEGFIQLAEQVLIVIADEGAVRGESGCRR